jgi:hypothetical protein
MRATVATIASTVAGRVAAGATKAWAAGQWLLNAALTANPIGLIVVAVAALVAGLIIAYKKSETFRNIVQGALKAVGSAAIWMWNNGFQPALHFIVLGLSKVIGFFAKVVGAIAKIPGPQQRAMKAVARALDSAADHVKGFANQIKKIPPSKSTKVKAETGAASDALGRIRNQIDHLPQNPKITVAIRAVISAAFQSKRNGLTARALGGPTAAFRQYLVGENGPEIWSEKRPGYITSNRDSVKALGSMLRSGGRADLSARAGVGRADDRAAGSGPRGSDRWELVMDDGTTIGGYFRRIVEGRITAYRKFDDDLARLGG